MLAGSAALLLTVAGCGHTDEEMAAKQREIDKLSADLKTANGQLAEDQAKYGQAQSEINELRGQLKQAGVDSDKLKQAVAEYKQRSEQLAAIEQRFRDLKTRLDKLTQVGLKVVVRNNRMVIQLPGDVLFDSGKDELKATGKDVLAQVAQVIGSDGTLAQRIFQVAGHTDNEPYGGGPFKDNWGLSVSRARTVLLYLITPKEATKPGAKPTGKGGGGLNPKNWSAAGYGETDPIAGTVENQSKDDRNKNRRVELVLQPNVEEMLNLNNIK
ncbi:OmpA family protein [Pendulispora albinea]|uniref:OmpA family protein n=1 Tax=Pendulispora albinea TaxID=2741071 RepID=A0ABZ2LVF4_9BACT